MRIKHASSRSKRLEIWAHPIPRLVSRLHFWPSWLAKVHYFSCTACCDSPWTSFRPDTVSRPGPPGFGRFGSNGGFGGPAGYAETVTHGDLWFRLLAGMGNKGGMMGGHGGCGGPGGQDNSDWVDRKLSKLFDDDFMHFGFQGWVKARKGWAAWQASVVDSGNVDLAEKVVQASLLCESTNFIYLFICILNITIIKTYKAKRKSKIPIINLIIFNHSLRV